MRFIFLLPLVLIPCAIGAAEPLVSFESRDGVLAVRLGEREVASYVYRDDQVSRPYWAHVKTPSGIQVTRQHPPRKDQDAVDHVGLHTGIWLSFGDLNGCDYWRLKARTEHVRFLEEPAGSAALGNGNGKFTVLNRYRATNGESTICEETCRYTVRAVSAGYLIEMDSSFRPTGSELVFGDQEEMGLGIRVATPLAVDRKQGGRILDSAGRRNGAEVWGKTAEWCDYSGRIDGKWVGLTVLTSPANFRPSWCHARDYGFVAMNPFGRRAFTKQEPSRLVIKSGEIFRLVYGVVVHESQSEQDYDASTIYRDFAKGTKK